MKMKKVTAALLAAFMTISLAACGGEAGQGQGSPKDTSVSVNEDNSVEEETKKAEESAQPENNEEAGGVEATDNNEETGGVESGQDTLDAEGSKTLVVYFSATGTTKGIAELAAETLQADIYEIVPQEPYTDADLDWHDDESRSTIEMNDSSSRPAINGSVEGMEQYDTIFIGYPIWWGEAPRIVSTFVESYSFAGKTVIPFCTSASSGIGSSGKNLEGLTDGATWLDGQRFGGGESAEDIRAWIEGLDL